MTQRFRHNGKWMSAEEKRNCILNAGIEPVEATNEVLETETSETTAEAPKPSKRAIVAELKALGVKFKANAKTEVLQELLNQSKTAQETETSESEQ